MKRSILFLLSFVVLVTVGISSSKVGKQQDGKDRIEALSHSSSDVIVTVDSIDPDFGTSDLIAIEAGDSPPIRWISLEPLEIPLYGSSDLSRGELNMQITNGIRCPRDGLIIKPRGHSNIAWLA